MDKRKVEIFLGTIIFLFMFFPILGNSQEIFLNGKYNACNQDSIFKNSPFFNSNGVPPNYIGNTSIQEHFRNKIGKVKSSNSKIIFKFILNCNGIITDVWVHKSTGIGSLDKKIIEEIKSLNYWKPAIYNKKNVDFEVTLLGAIKSKKIYLGTQMNPVKEFFEVE